MELVWSLLFFGNFEKWYELLSILIENFSVLESNLKSPKRWCYRIFGSVLSPSTGYGCEHLGSLFSSFWRHTKRLIREQHHACSMLAPLCRVSVYLPPPPPSLRVHISNSSIIEKTYRHLNFLLTYVWLVWDNIKILRAGYIFPKLCRKLRKVPSEINFRSF